MPDKNSRAEIDKADSGGGGGGEFGSTGPRDPSTFSEDDWRLLFM